MLPESKDEVTRRVALQLQIALTAWHELYPDDSDADACSKSLDLIEFELEDLLTRPDADPAGNTTEVPTPSATSLSDEELELMVHPSPPPESFVRPRNAPGPGAPSLGDDDAAELEALTSGRRPAKPQAKEQRGPIPFRQMLIEIGREYPGGLDISTIIEEAQARGWSHPNPRNYVSITASQLVRGGLLVRRDRGTYALSPAFIGSAEEEYAPEP